MLEPAKKQRMPEEEALEASLHVYLKALSERPVTPRNLVELERASKLARQILGLSQGQLTMTGGFEGAGYIMGESLQVGTNVGYDAPAPLAQSSPAETFGASIVREFLASLKEIVRPPQPSPAPFALNTQMSGADLVYAIAMAREKGMTDLEGALIEKLLAMADTATDKTLTPEEPKKEGYCGICGDPNEDGHCLCPPDPHARCANCDYAAQDHMKKDSVLRCYDGGFFQ
jgi:hypothetical protein